MNAIRPDAEAALGAPVQFVVNDLRMEGDAAFGTLQPQRPGGATIRWEETRMAAEGQDPQSYEGSTIHVLYTRVGGRWTVRDWSIGTDEVWWSIPEYCASHLAVIAEYCD
ncbi:MAG: hypothetical protein AAF415_06590 [Pseudomonadota bacterium]